MAKSRRTTVAAAAASLLAAAALLSFVDDAASVMPLLLGTGASLGRQLAAIDNGSAKKVAYLFISSGSISHEKIWESWLGVNYDAPNAGADEAPRLIPQNEARANVYVHASDISARRAFDIGVDAEKQPGHGPYFTSKIIPSVPTEYYTNLHDASK